MGILGYNEWEGSFGELIDDEIKDQKKWLIRILGEMNTSIEKKELLYFIGEIDAAIRYIDALEAITGDNVE